LKATGMVRLQDGNAVVARRIFELMGYVASHAEDYEKDRLELGDDFWMDAAMFCAAEEHL
jgi:hypothetical protein